MITPDIFPLKDAQAAYAVANTPLFLLRKLKEDGEVHRIAVGFSGEDILQALRNAVGAAPTTLYEGVRPYVCLVALWLNERGIYLRDATTINPSYSDDWFDYARQVLVETYKPTSRQTIHIPVRPSTATGTDTPVSIMCIDAASSVAPCA